MPTVSSPRLVGLGERDEQVARVAARREPERDVVLAGVGDELAREHEVEADVVAERGEHRRVVDEGAGRQRPAPRRVGRTARRATPRRWSCRRCRTRTAGHPLRSDRAIASGGVGRWPLPTARASCVADRRSPPPSPRADSARSVSKRPGVALVAFDERIEEVGARRSRAPPRSAGTGVDRARGRRDSHRRRGSCRSSRCRSPCAPRARPRIG